jgi:hypothetical protein
MRTNLDANLAKTLSRSGEQAVNTLMIQAGLSEQEANQFLQDHPETITVITELQAVRAALENPEAHAAKQQQGMQLAQMNADIQQQAMPSTTSLAWAAIYWWLALKILTPRLKQQPKHWAMPSAIWTGFMKRTRQRPALLK